MKRPVLFLKPGLLNFLYGAGEFDKIWAAFRQRERRTKTVQEIVTDSTLPAQPFPLNAGDRY